MFPQTLWSARRYKHGVVFQTSVFALSCVWAMHYPVLPASAFIAAFLILIPAFWHWPARHIPTLSLIVWLFATNIIYGVDSLAWSGDVRNKAPVWCDICECLDLTKTGLCITLFIPATKFIIGASVGLPACTLCLCKHLAMIGGGRTAGLDSGDLRRIAMFDFGICWGTPVVFMALRKSPFISS